MKSHEFAGFARGMQHLHACSARLAVLATLAAAAKHIDHHVPHHRSCTVVEPALANDLLVRPRQIAHHACIAAGRATLVDYLPDHRALEARASDAIVDRAAVLAFVHDLAAAGDELGLLQRGLCKLGVAAQRLGPCALAGLVQVVQQLLLGRSRAGQPLRVVACAADGGGIVVARSRARGA